MADAKSKKADPPPAPDPKPAPVVARTVSRAPPPAPTVTPRTTRPEPDWRYSDDDDRWNRGFDENAKQRAQTRR